MKKRAAHQLQYEPSNSPTSGMQNTTLGGFLRQERTRQRVSRPVLAQRTELGESALADFEFNRKLPSVSEIRLLARHLGLDETELLVRARYIPASQR